jgi:protein O-mannosyl-transferase
LIATLIVLTLAASVTGLPNRFVQDDSPIIASNTLVHSLRIWHLFVQAYWPFPYPRELYRPFTSCLLALEWVVGGGRPVLFRMVSILIYIGAVLAVYRLARRLLNPGAAWLAAALFAVHPVHVEAVAVAVNQAELVVGALLALMMTAYIDRRRTGEPLPPRWIAGMTLCYLAALLFKEHAVLLPALMVAAELTVIADPRPWRERVATLRPLFLLLVLATVSYLAIRNAALGGDAKGSFTAEALIGLGFGGRALTMLGIVPEWVRLFVWPAHLRADYAPQEFVAATHWGMAQSLGALALVAATVLAVACRKKRPVITFGVLWIAVGLVLVSNMIVTTGIILAERTLFLATIGVVIVGADLLWSAGARVYAQGSAGRIVTVVSLLVLLAMGATRSASRQLIWHDAAALWYQTVIDAPGSYRAQQAYGAVLFGVGMAGSGERHYQLAIALYPHAWPLLLDYADKLREHGRCDAALIYYNQVLALTPQQSGPRASEIACLIYLGHYAEAVREARVGSGYGIQTGTLALYRRIADSALKVNAPIGSVQLPPPIDSLPPQKP